MLARPLSGAMKNRIYDFDTPMKILGLEIADVGVIMGTWFFLFQMIGSFLPDRLQFLTAVIGTFLVYLVWSSFKSKVPRQFFAHFLGWLAERRDYEITPDIQQAPYVIDYQTVEQFQRQQRALERAAARARRQRRSRRSSRRA